MVASTRAATRWRLRLQVALGIWASVCTKKLFLPRSVLSKSRTPTDPAVWPKRARTVSRVCGRACVRCALPVGCVWLARSFPLPGLFSLRVSLFSHLRIGLVCYLETTPTGAGARLRRRPCGRERRGRRARVFLPSCPSIAHSPMKKGNTCTCKIPHQLDRTREMHSKHRRWAVSFSRNKKGIGMRVFRFVSVSRRMFNNRLSPLHGGGDIGINMTMDVRLYDTYVFPLA